MVEVHRYQWLGVVSQDTFERSFRGGFHDAVDFLDRGIACSHERQVDDGHVNRRHTNCITIQLAIQLGQDQTNGGSRTGLGGNHGLSRRTCTTQIFVHYVSEHLIVGVRMDGGHQAIQQTDVVIERLDQRRQAIGRAGGIRNHGVRGFQHALVHPEHHGCINVFATGRGDDHFFRATLEVRRCFFLGREKAGAFEDHIDTQLTPRDIRRIALREHANFVAIDDHVVTIDNDGSREFAMGGVVAGQMRVGFRVAQIVDGNDLNVIFFAAFIMSAQYIASDAAVAIDRNFDSHADLLSDICREICWDKISAILI